MASLDSPHLDKTNHVITSSKDPKYNCIAWAAEVTDAWTSKLGRDVDIEHDTLEALSGPLYGAPAIFMKRPLP